MFFLTKEQLSEEWYCANRATGRAFGEVVRRFVGGSVKMRHVLALLAMSGGLSGCAIAEAYWHKPNKYKAMPDLSDNAGDNPAVTTLSLDASRRLVVAQLVNPEPGLRRHTCPEPPPDVANNIFNQALAKAITKTGTDLSIGSAHQIVAQALHARTSTVEIWRTTSSMYCVLLMNGWGPYASSYLRASKDALSASKDTVVTSPEAAAFINGLVQDAAKQGDASKAAEEKGPTAGETAALQAAKDACEKVDAEKKLLDENCKKVAAEQAALPG